MDKHWYDVLMFWKTSCSALGDSDEIKSAIAQSRRVLSVAANTGAIRRAGPEVAENLQKAAEGLEKVSEGLEKAENFCKDIEAIERIHNAIIVLDDPGIMNEDSERAAKAFGNLLAGAGRLARHLPSPAKEYARILEQCGDFFVNMRRLIVPETRPGSQGRILRTINSGNYQDLR